MDTPISACWDITNKCNSTCKFCYRIIDNADIGYDKHIEILNKLLEFKLKKITFSGGEPLLVPHLPILLEKVKFSNITTSIITNGLLLPEKINVIYKNTDWITLPLDASSSDIYRKVTRGTKNQYGKLLENLFIVPKFNINLKINTVLNKININDITNIANIVKKVGAKRWKIFHFIPIRSFAKLNSSDFNISDMQFKEAINKAINVLSDTDCRITIADHDYLQNNYFWINSDGFVTVTDNCKDIKVGNILTDNPADIWKSKYFDHSKHYNSRKWI